jgi:two-component system, OmpR family, response regulator
MRILLVEDDQNMGESLRASFQAERYGVDWVRTAQEAFNAIALVQYDLVVLDLGLPDQSGLSVLAQMRTSAAAGTTDFVPVLIVTAKDALKDRVIGLDAGADDYLVKPFMLEELHARVRALIRRRSGAPSSVLQHGRLVLDLSTRRASADNITLDFSDREFAVLELLVLRAGRPVNKDQIQASLASIDANLSSNAIEVYVHRVRKKLEPIGVRVKTLRGLGYCLDKSVN